MSDCYLYKNKKRKKVPDHVLLITFDGIIGSYFTELMYDAKGNMFPEHSKIWEEGLYHDNLFLRDGVS